jgi:phosphatidylserine/phosphatidylglycerophosphate/cardiolipin synthase-like enzyme
MASVQVQAMFLRDTRHGGAPGQAAQVADALAGFVAGATATIDVAIYDFRLTGSGLAATVVDALTAAAARGVAVRIAYDAGKPAAADATSFAKLAADPAPPGTAQWVTDHFAGTAVQTRPITAPGDQLMHCKYVIRDGAKRYHTAAVWTGSTNFTDDAWTVQENNIVTLTSQKVARAYLADFDGLWAAGTITGTGAGNGGSARVGHATVGWDFAPGGGPAMDAALAAAVDAATNRVVLASMVITSHPLLTSLVAALGRGVPVSGIYDRGQMDPIEAEWAQHPSSAQTLAHWRTVKPNLAAKRSAPYTPTSIHDFMHNKIMITDSALTTGSYNLSGNAEHNAENQLRITHDPTLLDQYLDYVTAITRAYAT